MSVAELVFPGEVDEEPLEEQGGFDFELFTPVHSRPKDTQPFVRLTAGDRGGKLAFNGAACELSGIPSEEDNLRAFLFFDPRKLTIGVLPVRPEEGHENLTMAFSRARNNSLSRRIACAAFVRKYELDTDNLAVTIPVSWHTGVRTPYSPSADMFIIHLKDALTS